MLLLATYSVPRSRRSLSSIGYSTINNLQFCIYSHWTRNFSANEREKIRSTNNAASISWNARYRELVQYIQEQGSPLVPRDYGPLGRWVDKQRSHYKTDELSSERLKKLNQIGFVFEPQEVQWSERFRELQEYINEYGNSLVPQDYGTLGNWTQKQRYNYKIGVLHPERVQQLNEIDFVWDVLEAQWLERLEQLKKYRRENGDTLVPRNHVLGSWVWWQRHEYKIFMTKRKLNDEHQNSNANDVERLCNSSTGMTEERMQLLDSEDFIWDPKEYLWQLKFEELREWIALNGHGAISTSKNSNSPLETWAVRQRKFYTKYCSGEKTTLTKERIEKLQAIGFVLELRKKT